MARTALTAQDMPAAYASEGAAITFTAGDASDGNSVPHTGKLLVLARNTDASSHLVTVQSSADPFNREGDRTRNLAASEVANLGIFPTIGWKQSDGNLWIDVADATIELAVFKL